MPYPIEQRYRQMENDYRGRTLAAEVPHTIQTRLLHGIVVDVVYRTETGAFLLVQALPPFDSMDEYGDIEFEEFDVHRLAEYNISSTIEGDTKRYLKAVFPLNVDPLLLGLYYSKGDIVTFWNYKGTSEKVGVRGNKAFSKKINHWVTHLQDPTFYAIISPDGYTGGVPKYVFGGVVPNSSSSIKLRWKFYELPTFGGGGDPVHFSGAAYNLADMEMGLTSSSSSSGDPHITPQIVIIHATLNPDKTASDPNIWYYWFEAGGGSGGEVCGTGLQYQVYQKTTDDSCGFDWLRFH